VRCSPWCTKVGGWRRSAFFLVLFFFSSREQEYTQVDPIVEDTHARAHRGKKCTGKGYARALKKRAADTIGAAGLCPMRAFVRSPVALICRPITKMCRGDNGNRGFSLYIFV
jgi:hypothetical protein